MVIWHAVALGILQGLTEFFPISSSAHLELIPWMAGWDDFGDDASLKNGFDVALHLGTLVGALCYFRQDIVRYVSAGAIVGYRYLASYRASRQPQLGYDRLQEARLEDGRTAWLLAASAIPTALVGGIWASSWESVGDTIGLVVAMLALFAGLLWLADRQASARVVSLEATTSKTAPESALPFKTAAAMGLAQVCALVPGVSRSGVTITAGLFAQLPRRAATRFSFLMGLPVIAGAGLYKFIDIGGWDGIPVDYRAGFAWGVLTSAVSAWIAIWGLMRLLQRWSFTPFVVERMLLAALALGLLAAGVR